MSSKIVLDFRFLVTLLLLLFISTSSANLDLKLEGAPETGLFIQDISKPLNSSDFLLDDISNTRYFAVLQPKSSISLSAAFGPIQVKETLFPSSIQDALLNSNLELSGWPVPSESASNGHWNEPHDRQPLLYTLASTQQVSGHVVQSTVFRNNPSLDILLHLSRPNKHLSPSNHNSSSDHSAHETHSSASEHEHLSAVIAEEVGGSDTTEESVGTGEPKPTTDSVRATSALHNSAASASQRTASSSAASALHPPTEPANDLCAIVATCYQPSLNANGSPVSWPTSGHCRIGSCSLSSQDACLVRLTLPADWWPPVNLDVLPQVAAASHVKPPRPATASVGYAAVHTGHCGQTRLHQKLLRRLQSPEVKFNNPAVNQPLHQHVKKAAHPKHKSTDKASAQQHPHPAHKNEHPHEKHEKQFNHPLPPVFVEPLGQVQLKAFAGAYEELTSDDIIRVLIPQGPLRPRSRLHIPVCYRYHREYPLFAFALRVKVRAGLRVLGARLAARTPSSSIDSLNGKIKPGNNRRKNRLLAEYNRLNAPQDWRIAVEIGAKQTQATVTARVQKSTESVPSPPKDSTVDDSALDDEADELDDDLEEFDDDLMALMPATCREVFTVLVEVDDRVDQLDSGRIVFQLLYLSEFGENSASIPKGLADGSKTNKTESNANASESHGNPIRRDFERDSSKLTTKLDLRKDEVRSLLAISRSRHLLNTAVFTGRQIVQPLQIYVVSEAGKFGEVTLQASCISEDESVLKVSPSCSSLYLDGTESRPSTNATISIKYGSYAGQASFQVWMPKLPLEVALSDSKLNAIDRWLTPHLRRKDATSSGANQVHRKLIGANHSGTSSGTRVFTTGSNSSPPTHYSSHGSRSNSESHRNSDMDCRPRYQQTYVDVFARFFTADPQSGREFLLLGRRHAFKITPLVQSHFRLSDARVAAIQGRTVEGLSPGRTQLQILSPLNGRLLGSQQVTVTDEKVRIERLQVRLVTGVSLQVRPQLSAQSVADANANKSTASQGTHTSIFAHWPQPALWSVTARVSGQLRAQYQEGLLDIRMQFSDGSELALPDATDADYALRVNTFESPSLAYAPSLAAPGLPRLLALRSASAVPILLQVHPSQQCDRPHRLAPSNEAHNSINAGAVSLDAPLAEHTMLVDVSIMASTSDNQPEVTQHVQNDGHSQSSNSQRIRWHTSGSGSNEQLRSAAHLARAVHLVREPQVLARHQQLFDTNDRSWPTSSGIWVGAIAFVVFAMVGAALLVHRQRNYGMFAPSTPRQATTVTAVKPSDPDADGSVDSSDRDSTDSSNRKLTVQKVWGELRTFGAKCAAGINDKLSDGGPIYKSTDGSVTLRENPCNVFESHRTSCISHPDSEISIKMTSGHSDEDEIRSPTPNPTHSPLPNSNRLRSILEAQTIPSTNIPVFANATSVGYAANGFSRSMSVRQPPPPIPPRRQPLLMNGATFTKGRSNSLTTSGITTPGLRPGIGRQLPNPAHLPGMAMRRHVPPPIPPHRQANQMNYKQSPKIISNPLGFTQSTNSPIHLEDETPRQLPQPNLANRRLITNPFLNEFECQPLQTYVRSPPGISCVGGSLGSSDRSSAQRSDSSLESIDEIPMTRSVSFETPLTSSEVGARKSIMQQTRCGSSLDSQAPLYLNLSGPPVPPHQTARSIPIGTVSQPDSAVTSPEHVMRAACSDDDILHEQEKFRKMDHKELVEYIENLKESCA